MATLLLYLADAEEGGETAFPETGAHWRDPELAKVRMWTYGAEWVVGLLGTIWVSGLTFSISPIPSIQAPCFPCNPSLGPPTQIIGLQRLFYILQQPTNAYM
jgi:hypothetical protein